MAGNLLEKQSRTRLETTKEKDQDNTTTMYLTAISPMKGQGVRPPGELSCAFLLPGHTIYRLRAPVNGN